MTSIIAAISFHAKQVLGTVLVVALISSVYYPSTTHAVELDAGDGSVHEIAKKLLRRMGSSIQKGEKPSPISLTKEIKPTLRTKFALGAPSAARSKRVVLTIKALPNPTTKSIRFGQELSVALRESGTAVLPQHLEFSIRNSEHRFNSVAMIYKISF